MSTPSSAAITVALAVLAERRRSPRSRIEERLPGYLLTDSGQRLSARGFDVSARGLGCLSPNSLPIGSVVVWIVANAAHKFDLVHCESDRSGNYHLGMKARDHSLDVYAVALASMRNMPPEWDPGLEEKAIGGF